MFVEAALRFHRGHAKGESMNRIVKILGLCLVVLILPGSTGCAFFTAQRVATMAGKHVAKEVVKKGIKDAEEDKAKKDQAKKDQANRDRARRQEAERAQMKKSQTQKPATQKPATQKP